MKFAGVCFVVAGLGVVAVFALAIWSEHVSMQPEGGRFADEVSDVDTQSPPDAWESDAEWHRRLPSGLTRSLLDDPWKNLDDEQFAAATRRENYTYKVRLGDSVETLAKKFLGDERLAERIVEANPEIVGSGGLSAGSEIVIPFRFRR